MSSKKKQSPRQAKQQELEQPNDISNDVEKVDVQTKSQQQPETDISPPAEQVQPKPANDSKPTEVEVKADTPEPEVVEPTLSGWLASGFSSMVKSAKDTVNNSGAIESIKRDLNELKCTVQSASASTYLQSAASMVKGTLNEIGNTVNEISTLGVSTNDNDEDDEKSETTDTVSKSESEEISLFNFSSLNTFATKFGESARSTLTAVKEVVVDTLVNLNDFAVDELTEDAFVFHNGTMLPLTNWPGVVKRLQTDSETFLKEPEGAPEEFEHWLSTFSLIDYEKQMEHLIETVEEVKTLRSSVVPDQLSENDFWHRYYYKLHQAKTKCKNDVIAKFEADQATKNTSTPSPTTAITKNASDAPLSRSSTEEWDKMGDSKATSQVSDDEKDWVKCE